MSKLHKLEEWADHHHPKWIEYLRILLGLILLIKGIAYVINKDEVILMVAGSEYWVVHYIIAHYVIGGYIVCGIAIAVGLFTRVAAAFEIPALLGSIVFLDIHKDLFTLNSQLGYTIIILALLLFYLLYGPGQLSIDNYLQKHKDKNYDLS